MAINFKKIILDGFIELLEEYPLNNITITQILENTGVSRQTFYNHFKDKNDLIQYAYDVLIIPDFNGDFGCVDFKASLIKTLNQMKKYKKFMIQACKMNGQNCLKEYIFNHCMNFDLKWHEHIYGGPLPEELSFATIYHANASSSMTLSWVLGGMVVDAEELAEMITNMRSIGMDVLFKDANKNPYRQN